MIVKWTRIEIQSRKDLEMIDITDRIESAVAGSGVRDGLAWAMTAHTSAGLLVTGRHRMPGAGCAGSLGTSGAQTTARGKPRLLA